MAWSSKFQLRILEGPASGHILPLEGKKLKIGRQMKPGQASPRDGININDATISKFHAELRWNGWNSTYTLHHRSSTNLTRVNGQPITSVELKVGDRIGMGSGLLELQHLGSFSALPTPQEQLVRIESLQCPRDRSVLTPSNLRDVPFESCSYCNGAWLEQGRLARIHGHSEDLEGAVPVVRSDCPNCPNCGTPTWRVYLPGSGGLEVARCQSCQGIWLDTDGLKDVLMGLRKVYGTSAAPASATPPAAEAIAPVKPPAARVGLDAPVTPPHQRGALLDKLRKNRAPVPEVAAPERKTEVVPPTSTAEESEGPSVSAVVDTMLKEAVSKGVSDIHIEGVREEVRVRYRVDGQLTVAHIWAKSLQNPVLSRLQVLAQLNIANPWLPQDGHFAYAIGGVEYDFRLATVPSERGLACVIRILEPNRKVSQVHQLGFHPEDLKLVQKALNDQQGFILATGPSGSGKTTTLYALLAALTARPTKTVTIEDPVEYRVDQVVQVPVNHRVGMDFARGLRAVLRLDPDSILVGEIRDRETAEIAVQASLTGHLLFSTLHTRGTVESIFRLIEMGIEPYLTKEVINCIIAQRLVRVLCPHCREEYSPPDNEFLDFGIEPAAAGGQTFYRPIGCHECFHLGYKGRTGVMEVLIGSQELRDSISDRATAKDIRAVAVKAGMRTLRLNAYDKLCQGVTSFEEARQVIGST